ncbi:phosphoribosyltransferase [Arthrobacter sp. Leaf69]|nr:phosphoribosyltransferase [Arthrobacter sp. Leaf69]
MPRRAADPDLTPAATAAARHRGAYRQPLARVADLAAAAAAEVLALAAPVDCVCCGAEDLALCGGCERQLRLLMRTPFRAEAQAPALVAVDGSVLLPVVAAGAYRAELAQALLSFKKHGQRQLAGVLSKGLAEAIRAAAGESPGLLIVPVPTSGSAYRRRGFSPVHVLLGRAGLHRVPGAGRPSGLSTAHALRTTRLGSASARAGQAAVPVTAVPQLTVPVLTAGARCRLPGPLGGAGGQKALGRGERAQRVRGSMRVRRGVLAPVVHGQPCIIVDDVLTTGATLAEAARALRAAGALVRGAVVLAATRPPVALDFGPADPEMAGNGPVKEKNKPKKDE